MWRQLLGVWGFSLWLYPPPSISTSGQEREREDGNNKNKWMEVAVGTLDRSHTDMEPWTPSPALASLGTCCSAQSNSSSLALEIQPGFLHRPPLDLPPTPSSLPQHPQGLGVYQSDVPLSL